MPAVMVQGTSSWAGKSLIATALCRHLARCGVRVAPFKAQNMSNNARVVDGGEIGVAQYLQALAARTEPDVRMNPILVKPEGLTRSQVVVSGRADPAISTTPWRERAPLLWPAVTRSLHSLIADYDVLVLEGAGSEEARRRIRGFIVNKFLGDASLLAPAPERLAAMTGVPVIGIVPWFGHQLPDEDGAATPVEHDDADSTVAVVRYPFASNLDEFKTLEQVTRVRWARLPADLDNAWLVVLPGSKHVVSDLAWLRSTGLDRSIAGRVRSGLRTLGVCGGLQMLGQRLHDPVGVEGGDAEGLGLLPVETTFESNKLARRTTVQFAHRLGPAWSSLANLEVRGYEIRHGRTAATATVSVAIRDNLGWVDGPVLGVTVHGLLEDPAVLQALFGKIPRYSLDEALDALTDTVMANLDVGLIEQLVGISSPPKHC